jgi:hypothetical protein
MANDEEERYPSYESTTLRSRSTATALTLRQLGDLSPTTLATMHGTSFRGDGKAALYDLAAGYEALITRG